MQQKRYRSDRVTLRMALPLAISRCFSSTFISDPLLARGQNMLNITFPTPPSENMTRCLENVPSAGSDRLPDLPRSIVRDEHACDTSSARSQCKNRTPPCSVPVRAREILRASREAWNRLHTITRLARPGRMPLCVCREHCHFVVQP